MTEANKKNKYSGAFGLACHDGTLFALESMGKLHRLDLATGAIEQTLDLGTPYVGGLDWDGQAFVVGSRTALHFVDARTGKVTKTLPVEYPVRALTCRDGRIYVLEQPVFGFNRKHEHIRVWPQKTVVHVVTPPK